MRNQITKMGLFLFCFCFFFLPELKAAHIQNIRLHESSESCRIVLDSEEPLKYDIKASEDETKLVIQVTGDVKIEKLQDSLKMNDFYATSAKIIKNNKGLQIHIQFKEPSLWKVFSLKGPDRLVIDLFGPADLEKKWQLEKGVEYRFHRFRMNGKLVQTYTVQIAPGAAKIFPILGQDQIGKRENVKSMAIRYGAIAAINGGYFSATGEYLGNLKLDGEWVVGSPQQRTAWGFTEKGLHIVDPVSFKAKVSVASLPNWSLPIEGLNIPRGNDSLVLYSAKRGLRTGSNEWGKELVIENNQVVEVVEGNASLKPKRLVLSAHGTKKEMIDYLETGEKVKIDFLIDSKWEKARHVMSAGPRLVKAGKLEVTSKQESFPSDISVGRAPRTAIGQKKDGTILLMVVDGRSQASVGMTLEELGRYLIDLGAYDAMNLDGGGSSEMVIGKEIKNNPSDGRERFVSSGIVVVAN